GGNSSGAGGGPGRGGGPSRQSASTGPGGREPSSGPEPRKIPGRGSRGGVGTITGWPHFGQVTTEPALRAATDRAVLHLSFGHLKRTGTGGPPWGNGRSGTVSPARDLFAFDQGDRPFRSLPD